MDYQNQPIRIDYRKGEERIFPVHKFVKNWQFSEGEEDEAALANYVATVAKKGGMNENDLQHLFPAILRMLRSDIKWAGQKSKGGTTMTLPTKQEIEAAAFEHIKPPCFVGEHSAFTAGAEWHKQQMQAVLGELADDYERRRNTLQSMLGAGDLLPYDRERLKGKLEMCNSFLTDINRILG